MPNKEVTIEDLAGMMKEGFDGMDEQFSKVNERFTRLETGQEDIKLRLDQAAYRFELQALQERVEVLEKHMGVNTAKVKHP